MAQVEIHVTSEKEGRVTLVYHEGQIAPPERVELLRCR